MPYFDPDKRLKRLGWFVHIVGLAVGVAVAAGGFYGALGPLWREGSAWAARSLELESQCRRLDRVREKHGRLRRKLDDLDRQKVGLRKRVPDQPHEAEFLVEVTRLAQESGLSIHNYRPGPPTTKDQHAEMEIDLAGQGAYASLCQFLGGLPGLARRSSVKRLDVSPQAADELYPVRMTLVIYSNCKW